MQYEKGNKLKLTALFWKAMPLMRTSVGTPSILQYAYNEMGSTFLCYLNMKLCMKLEKSQTKYPQRQTVIFCYIEKVQTSSLLWAFTWNKALKASPLCKRKKTLRIDSYFRFSSNQPIKLVLVNTLYIKVCKTDL